MTKHPVKVQENGKWVTHMWTVAELKAHLAERREAAKPIMDAFYANDIKACDRAVAAFNARFPS